VGLGDEPVEAQDVSWWSSSDSVKKIVPSDVQGISEVTFDPPPAGELTVFAQLEGGPQVELSVWVASTAVIKGHSADQQHSVKGGKPRLLWVDVAEGGGDDVRLLAHYPVLWTLAVETPKGTVLDTISIATDAQGRSGYLFNPETEGNFSLTARLAFDFAQTREFKLSVLTAFEWKVDLTLLGGDEVPVPIIPGLDELNLFRNAHYRLEISAAEPEKLAGSAGAIGWSSNYTTQALAMAFDPRMAERFTFEADQPLTVDIRTGDVRNGRFQLSLVCDRLTEALVLNGTLSRRP